MSLRTWAAWGVHLYTALGAPIGVVALVASASGDYRLAFLCMAVATFVDATDGMMARRVGVKQVLPNFDGARLDDIVDYLNFVVVPIVLAHQAGLLPSGWIGLLIASAPMIASGYGFSQTEAKVSAPATGGTSNYYFTGFPSYWNIVVFYYFVLQTPVAFNVFLTLLLSVLVFVPIRYLYPSRNTVARNATYILGVIWAAMVVFLMIELPEPSLWLAWASLFYPVYYFALSLYLHAVAD